MMISHSMFAGLNMRDLHYFLVVAEELHFGRAAERLRIAQPQLSQVIRRLEDFSKVKIFTRRPRVRLTAAGEILVEMAKRIEVEVEAGMDHAHAVGSGKLGTVRLGFSAAAMLGTIPQLLEQFTSDHPEVTVILIEGKSSSLWDMLERNELDLIISRDLRYDTVAESTPIINEDMMVVMSEKHPLSSATEIKLSDLSEEPFVFFRRGSAPSYYDRIIEACHKAGLYPKIRQEADSSSVILALVNAGFGISFSSKQTGGLKFSTLCYKPIADTMPPATFWLSNLAQHVSPSSEALLRYLLESFSDDRLPRASSV